MVKELFEKPNFLASCTKALEKLAKIEQPNDKGRFCKTMVIRRQKFGC